MNAGECADNTCWDTINTVNASGYFSFGSHSTTHRDFGQISLEEGILDLERSKQAILENTGIQVYTLAWPFETCSPYPESLEQIGITLAWGGSTKPLSQNFAAWQDPRPFCLPRLLPPNIQDVSMRPAGMSLQYARQRNQRHKQKHLQKQVLCGWYRARTYGLAMSTRRSNQLS